MATPSFPALNADRLWARVEALSKMTRPDAPWTRRAFSPLFLEAREWLRGQFLEAGLSARLDAGGNLVGRLQGHGTGAKPLVTGSHCDTVAMGGRFDGIIGVLAGVEVAHTLHENGLRLKHPLEVIDFLSEEPSDYGVSCIGSRALTGQLSDPMLQATDPAGETLAEGMRRIGADPQALADLLRPPGSVAAFVELHIEQGPVLEARGLPIGVVTDIVGIHRVSIVVDGRPDHAGTTPMGIRADALAGAALVIDEVRRRATALDGSPHYVVATVGRLSLTPNASNAVPGRVEMTMEVRSNHRSALDSFPGDVLEAVRRRLQALRVSADMRSISRSEPTACDPLVMGAIERAAGVLGHASMRMPSGAGHDAAYMARCGPAGMVFVPCLNGRSHCPEEWIEPRQLFDGAQVLLHTLLELDRSLD